MSADRHDQLADALFAAARRERADTALRELTLRAMTEPPIASRRWRPLAALALAACLGAGLWVRLRPSPNLPGIAAESGSHRVPPARRVLAPPASRGELAQPTASERERVRITPPAAVPRAKPKPSSSAPVAPSTLEQELGLLDRARSNFAAGDSSGALARLDEYDKVAKNGRLTVEARLLRIQVLAKAGERARAAELARQFVAEYPDSPLTDRARGYAGVASGGQHSQEGQP